MFQNYLITALRNFTRHKLYSFINIAGLTVGLTCAIFIILFVRDELSYDKWILQTENCTGTEVTWHIPGQPPQVTIQTHSYPMRCGRRSRSRSGVAHLERRQMTVSAGNRQFPDPVNASVLTSFRSSVSANRRNPSTVFANESAVLRSAAR